MEQRRAVTAEVAARYRQGSKKEKARVLDDFLPLPEYALAYAQRVLRNHGRRVYMDQQTVLGGDARKRNQGQGHWSMTSQ